MHAPFRLRCPHMCTIEVSLHFPFTPLRTLHWVLLLSRCMQCHPCHCFSVMQCHHVTASVSCSVAHVTASVSCSVTQVTASVSCSVTHVTASVSCSVTHVTASVSRSVTYVTASVSCSVVHVTLCTAAIYCVSKLHKRFSHSSPRVCMSVCCLCLCVYQGIQVTSLLPSQWNV